MSAFTEPQLLRLGAFQTDFAEGVRAVLASLGCAPLPATLDPSEVCLAYANYKFRRIRERPRETFKSDTLRHRTNLSVDERVAIDAIEEKFRTGADLYPHQSTTILRPVSNDGLLADWGVQHLHLGLPSGKPTAPPFVNRSPNVLLVRVTDDAAYLIDCLPHGHGVQSPWWNIDLPETLHRNWPDSLSHFRVDGYEPKLSWEDHRRIRPLRGATINMAVTTSDGTSYLLSEGMVTTGHSMVACQHADRLQRYVRDIALDREDDEKLVVQGDHRELHVYVKPR